MWERSQIQEMLSALGGSDERVGVKLGVRRLKLRASVRGDPSLPQGICQVAGMCETRPCIGLHCGVHQE